MICNKCGKKWTEGKGGKKHSGCTIKINWDYFSHKDGEIHQFTLCEECYDKITARFIKPVHISQCTELI